MATRDIILNEALTLNAAIRSALIKAFEARYFKHNNEADENMCY